MDPLATAQDVETQLGRDLTETEQARVEGILAKASDLFRRKARQDFTLGESTVRLKSNGGEIRLEQEPVTAVTTVVDDCGAAVDHRWAGQLLWVTRNGCPLGSHEFVTVTYSHGGEVPDLVRQTIAEVVARVLNVDSRALSGVVTATETTGPFSETLTYAGWAVGGQTMLSPADEAIALSYRYPGGQTIVLRP
ncbi:putative bacteriophage protein [Nocardia nova SH22a]|uniref:Putative bacteriophage protein n=1 Tax=Nocardia nova SH22a TaxID=1415166 RepID=W5TUL8_9NOCA|nr:hypothetical protein [Nocardia nova]AHH20851.1 putative bacteriophage protein [Nocardia nova SH22a]